METYPEKERGAFFMVAIFPYFYYNSFIQAEHRAIRARLLFVNRNLINNLYYGFTEYRNYRPR